MKKVSRDKQEVGNTYMMYPEYSLKDIDFIHMVANRVFEDHNRIEKVNKATELARKYGITKEKYRDFVISLFHDWIIFGGDNNK